MRADRRRSALSLQHGLSWNKLCWQSLNLLKYLKSKVLPMKFQQIPTRALVFLEIKTLIFIARTSQSSSLSGQWLRDYAWLENLLPGRDNSNVVTEHRLTFALEICRMLILLNLSRTYLKSLVADRTDLLIGLDYSKRRTLRAREIETHKW